MNETRGREGGALSWRSGQALALLLSCILLSIPAGATPLEENAASAQLIYAPIGDQSHHSFHLVFPPQYQTAADGLKKQLHHELDTIGTTLGIRTGFRTQVELMNPKKFYRTLKLPTWTNAIYLRSRIIIPMKQASELSHHRGRDLEQGELQRAVRHELVHAVIDHQTKGACPGWLDEGIAQLLEGPEHPILRQALQRWVQKERMIPLHLLQTGFTKLPQKMVPAAYAQSLYAVKLLLNEQSPSTVKELFYRLRRGQEFRKAFRTTFSLSFSEFEASLQAHLKDLANSKDGGQTDVVWRWNYDTPLQYTEFAPHKAQMKPSHETRNACKKCKEE
ncbi:hypothetical protein MRY87_05515 [bacterium]|nr:hypothetical protein [bacterium]